ncbi:hypothetical protein [Rickettsia typhi]|uniref:Uncharacterized protein n=2 Tax=Rickettsia typhi TaxID=785 RepID=Q68WX6_RICTY|nr:hypothetical protein [Rickettsia typhi]AAU03866.1 rickettsial conserved hypothetical protein [Rickettsia typhi str. Wilmington]AFE54245.1 hypothetical protein RTTH1527_01900 [Rickettsia typhi str. TH1527]AFE55085.1 hypothetical protein RTB9991CWPP_01910 [Rickettsia typhi str. B9991CWPP]
MQQIEKYIKKKRNAIDAQVKKYKQALTEIGIKYDCEFAHVAVPNHATGRFEYFKWDWMTSTTSSHSEIVQIFQEIVMTLQAAKNNPIQYENLASRLDSNTQDILAFNIQQHNIIVPTIHISQSELVQKALEEAAHCTKVSNVTAEFKNYFSKLDPDGVVEFMNCTKGTTINVDGCVGTSLLDNAVNIKYPATWNGILTQKFFIENGITNPYASFEEKIDKTVQEGSVDESSIEEVQIKQVELIGGTSDF